MLDRSALGGEPYRGVAFEHGSALANQAAVAWSPEGGLTPPVLFGDKMPCVWDLYLFLAGSPTGMDSFCDP